MQFLNRKVSVLGIFYVSNISKNLCFLTVNMCSPYDTAGSGVAQGRVFFSLGNNESYAFSDIK